MSTVAAAILKTTDGTGVPLRGVSASGRLTGLLFELTVEQIFENAGKKNIEAVYTFPVPHRAVLLGLDLEIGERKLSGVAVRRKVASERYEEAIDEGNSAALLEQAGDGLYTLSLGNLLAGERAVIRYRYAELLDRHEDYIRLSVPTVIAPRYGDAAVHGVQAHQVPGVDLLASYPFSVTIDVLGDQAGAALSSPTHLIAVSTIDGGKRIVLGAGAALDRDFILQLTGAVTASASITARNGDGYVSLVSLDPQLREETLRSLCLKLVVDCSGSMGGDSIAQARRALLAVLGRLTPADAVSLTRFGSNFEHLIAPGADVPGEPARSLFSRVRNKPPVTKPGGAMAIASPPTVEWFRHAVQDMDADLGGTELAGALQAAMAIPTPQAGVKDLLLITDGEVWAVEQVVDLAARSGHRLFVVAVGAAPAESLARQLSEKAGGACEFVSPNEDIEGAILRMFQRLRESPKRVTKVEWPVTPDWEAPVPAMVFSGDTLHLLAGFTTKPIGNVRVTISGAACGELTLPCAVSDPVDLAILPRVAAARRLASLDEEEAGALAEQYQLVSRHTSFVVVQVRAEGEKAETLPTLKKVEQMLAAGWGATGRLTEQPSMYSSGEYGMQLPPQPRRAAAPSASRALPEMAVRSDQGRIKSSRRMSRRSAMEDGPQRSLDRYEPDALIHGIKPYRARPGEAYMNPAQLEHFRQILTAWRRELMEEVDRTVHHMQDDASNFPDPNDRATQESEFSLELRTRDRERKLLKKIDAALERIGDRAYGYCEETGEEIGLKRLEARPVATLSLEAQERREMAERQYGEQHDHYLGEASQGRAVSRSPEQVLATLALTAVDGLLRFPATIQELALVGVPTRILLELESLAAAEGHTESDLVKTWLALLARSPAGAALAAKDRATLEGTVMTDRGLRSVRAAVQQLVANLTATSWETLESPEEQDS